MHLPHSDFDGPDYRALPWVILGCVTLTVLIYLSLAP